jgi:hypothetical protein
VDLPEDRSNSTFDGRDGKVDGTDERGAVNTLQHACAVETTATASPQPPPNVAPERMWHEHLAREAVAAYIGTDPIDRTPKNTFQYSTATLVAITDHHYHLQDRLQATDD